MSGEPSESAQKRTARLERRNAALALRSSLSPAGPAPSQLRIATWNLNSLRARLLGLERFLERAAPDVICLQETKTATVPKETLDLFAEYGYRLAHVGVGAYNGVGVLARHPISDVRASGAFDDEFLDALSETLAKKLVDRMPDGDIRDEWLCGAAAAAAYLNWPTQRVYKNIRRLPHRRDGSLLMFKRRELDAYLDGFYSGPPELAPSTVGVPHAFPGARNPHE